MDLRKQTDHWSAMAALARTEFGARALKSFEDQYTQDKNMQRLTGIYQSVRNQAESTMASGITTAI